QWYESCAHLTIEIDELGILETVDYIKSALKLY
ncbi:shikimate kinase, partial [Turicibacter sanguinis]|nr:shikimate kinase [Turicibacter sanguinis]